MNDKRPEMNGISEDAIERALARLAAVDAEGAPKPSEALMARVLADAARHCPPAVPLPHAGATRGGVAGRAGAIQAVARGGRDLPGGRALRPVAGRGRIGWLGGAGAAAALAAGLALGFVTGLKGPETEIMAVAMAAEEEVIVVSDAGLALFGAESPF